MIILDQFVPFKIDLERRCWKGFHLLSRMAGVGQMIKCMKGSTKRKSYRCSERTLSHCRIIIIELTSTANKNWKWRTFNRSYGSHGCFWLRTYKIHKNKTWLDFFYLRQTNWMKWDKKKTILIVLVHMVTHWIVPETVTYKLYKTRKNWRYPKSFG